MEKQDIISDSAEIQRIIIGNYKQLYANKLQNLEEIDKFLDIYNLPRLNHKEIQNLNRPITSNQNEAITTKLPAKRGLGPNGFTAEHFIKHLKEDNLIPILLKLL